MKKSLSVVLSTAMAVSVFASAAFAETAPATTTTTGTAATATAVKTSADFKDLAGIDAALKAKIDAMLAKGYFEGVSADSFGINENMTRAQFAKILALVAGVTVDESVKTSSFADVKADDAANSWAIPFIEAAKKAGLIDGKSSTSYDPAAKVTLGELATALVKATGAKVDTTGTPWYSDAVKQAVALKVLPEGTDGSKFALRSDLVVGAHGTDKVIADSKVPAKASVSAAKAVGAQKVEVTLSKAVDTAVATLTLKKGATTVATTAAWSDDKKVATLTLKDNVKITDGEYSVTLAGLEAAAIDQATAKFTGQNEAVKKIEFATTGDTIAQSAKARIKIVAQNQYGEATKISASNFTVVTSGFDNSVTKAEDGSLVVTIKTDLNTSNQATTPGLTVIPVYVYDNETRTSAQKSFKLGTASFVSKVELGDVKYNGTNTSLNGTGEIATIAVNQYDQYGNPVAMDSGAISNINTIVTPYSDKIKAEYGDFNNDNFGEVRVSLTGNVETSGDYTVTIYAGSASATAKVAVKSTKLAVKLALGDFTGTLAQGDAAKDKYIPLIAYDADGNQLSATDIVNAENLNRIKLNGTNVNLNGAAIAIQTVGEHKGKIRLNNVTGNAGDVAYITAYIATAGTNSYVNTSIPINKVRVPDSFKVATEATVKTVGTTDDVKFNVLDQYGEVIDSVGTVTDVNVGSVVYKVKVEATETAVNDANGNPVATNLTITGHADNDLMDGVALANGQNREYTGNLFGQFNKGFNFAASSTSNGGKIELKATLLKRINNEVDATNAPKWREVTSVSRSMINIDGTETLNYTISSPGELFAAKDSALVDADQKDVANGKKLAKEVKVSAKDAAGSSVTLPDNRVLSVTSSTYEVATTAVASNTGWVMGNKAGTATLTVLYKDMKDLVKQGTVNVTVKSELPKVATMTADGSKTFTAPTATAAATYMNLAVKDQYGIEYKDGNVGAYNKLLGVSFAVEDQAGGVAVTLNSLTGAITVTGTGTFTLYAYSPDGKVATTYVTVN